MSPSLLPSDSSNDLHNLSIYPTRRGWGGNPSHFPPALRSVTRATAAILPCPICLGYTSQAGHKCGMTVQEGRRRGRKRQSERSREGDGGRRPRHRDAPLFFGTLRLQEMPKQKQGSAFWQNVVLFPPPDVIHLPNSMKVYNT